MKAAMEITESRRAKQIEFNQEHGVTPQTIQKEIKKDILEELGKARKNKRSKDTLDGLDLKNLSHEEIDERIKLLTEQMKKKADELEFEQASNLRDEIKELKELRLFY